MCDFGVISLDRWTDRARKQFRGVVLLLVGGVQGKGLLAF